MATVFTIQGAEDQPVGGACKKVSNPRNGCVTLLCKDGRTRSGKARWRFKKGSTRCPHRGR
jgi:hypothetical protein